MDDATFEHSMRAMMDNRIYLDQKDSSLERQAFGAVMKQGIPANCRAQFWNLCTGIHMYQRGYCADYY